MNPLKVKVFSYCTQNISKHTELQLNEWLAENPDIEIVRMLQSESVTGVKESQIEHNLTITVVYREPEAS